MSQFKRTPSNRSAEKEIHAWEMEEASYAARRNSPPSSDNPFERYAAKASFSAVEQKTKPSAHKVIDHTKHEERKAGKSGGASATAGASKKVNTAASEAATGDTIPIHRHKEILSVVEKARDSTLRPKP